MIVARQFRSLVGTGDSGDLGVVVVDGTEVGGVVGTEARLVAGTEVGAAVVSGTEVGTVPPLTSTGARLAAIIVPTPTTAASIAASARASSTGDIRQPGRRS
jgi:hypothetical protein